MMNSIIFILLAFVIKEISCIFCSAACKPNFCTGPSSNQCTDCDSPYKLNGTNCLIDPTSGYVQFATLADINSNLASTTSCGSYSTYGPFYNGDVIRLNLQNSINFPHYSLRLIAWTFLQDAWTGGQIIKGTLSSTGQIVSKPASSYSTAQLLCGWSTTVDWYLKLDLQFAHTAVSNNDRIDITTTQSTSQPWGIKQIMVLVGKCHIICQACTGGTVNLCSACTTGYKLSGTTCNQTCLYKYGQTSVTTVCVACNPYCTICNMTSNNCSACQINGTYSSYLSGTTCLLDCPLYSTQNTTTHICIPCNNTNCQICPSNQPSNCIQCLSPGSYWFNFDCILTCPNGYYANAPNCTQCDNSCLLCTGSPSPCTQCRLGYYLYVDQCLNPCPTGYFPEDTLRICLDCITYCVRASITISLDTNNLKLITTITFNKRIDFSNFPIQTFQTISNDNPQIPLSKFQIIYTVIDQYSYKIQLVPIGLINMTDTNFTVIINPKTQQYYSKDPYPFSVTIYDLQAWQVWSLIILPQMQQNQQLVIDMIEQINNKINIDFSGQFVQEIKKTGLFAFLLPGAQLSSIIILHNSIPAQNFYQGSRFWASFIYFQVPKWEDGPNSTKFIVTQQVDNLKYINLRLLQLSSVSNWRFYRTGFTNFFLFDTYLISSLLVVSWLILLIPKLFHSRLTTNKRSIFYNILHKIHQISIFYISMSVALQWLNMSDKISSETNLDYTYVYSSFGVSIVVCVYIMFYQVYVFYQLIPYCAVQILSHKYTNYLQKYSYFLRDLRYQHYKSSKQYIEWTPRHMLRPYNYQILSCIRLILLVIAPCIFHDYPLVSIACIISIQISEILRFIFIWPYNSLWRNLIKLVLQICLLLIYIISMLTYTLIVYLYQNLNIASDQTVKLYFLLGWFGFSCVFFYNLLWIAYLVVDIVIGCRFTNKERMDASRNQYYSDLLSEFENKNMKKLSKDTYQELKNHERKQYEKSYKKMYRQLDLRTNQKDKIKAQDQETDQYDDSIINKMRKKKSKFVNFMETVHGVDDLDQIPQEQDSKKFIRDLISKGNLNNKDQDQLKTISILIEEYQDKYLVKILKVPGVFLRNKISQKIEDNTLVPKRNTKQILLHNKLNFQYYRIIHNIFTLFASISTQTVTIRTYLIVNQNLYAPTQQVPQVKQNLKQVIQIRDYNGNVEKERLDQLLEGFPIPNQLLEKL